MNGTIVEIERYIDFITRIYKIEVIRTRRVLVENQIIISIIKMKHNKYVLISLLKLFRTFL